ncbi:MAG: PKD domain-containing protein [Chloroflexota bacterium]|nr:PKD domain-containing protein [Chloroflexota bacterium]
MTTPARHSRALRAAALVCAFIVLIACNLTGGGEPTAEPISTTTPAFTLPPTRTPATTGGAPTPLPGVTLPSSGGGQTAPTVVGVVPTGVRPPAATQGPTSIVILSPVPGNVIAGGVQIIGAATHPNFLQYQVEYGPDPNPGGLWYPATGAVQSPILNGLLGIWNTTTVNDGLYAVRLRVYLRDGTTLTTVNNNIRVQNNAPTPVPSPTPIIARPTAAFTQDQVQGFAPLTVRFTNQSSGTITAYSWNFGDGTTSTELNPTHTFTNPGLYTVTLTVTGPGGTANVATQINVQSVAAPVAAFSAIPPSGFAPLQVTFFNLSSGNITNVQWTFGDGTSSNQSEVNHTYLTPNTYSVTLTVSGPGGTSSTTQLISVQAPVATLTPPPTFTPDARPTEPIVTAIVIVPTSTVVEPTKTPEPPTVTPTVFIPTNTPEQRPTEPPTFTPVPTVTPVPPSFTPEPTFTPIPPTFTPEPTFTSVPTETPIPPTFTPEPTFTPLPTSTSTPEPTATATLEPTFTQEPTFTPDPVPSGAAAAVIPNPAQPRTVQFTFTPDATSGTITSFVWDFGDGSSSNEQNPLHTYAAGGTYPVTVTLNGVGGSNVFNTTVTVPTAPAANFTFATDLANSLTVTFTDTSTGDYDTYLWDFGDGATSNEANPTHLYTTSGSYPVTLTVTNSVTGESSTSPAQSVNVVLPFLPPIAGFVATVDPTNSLSVSFADVSSGDYDTYAWDFESDGVIDSTDADPTFQYATGGTYTATLTVTNSQTGEANSISQQVTVTEPSTPPTANFSFAIPDEANDPLTVSFSDASTGDFDTYTWDFESDGVVDSTDANPMFTYPEGNTYTVTLTVTNSQTGESSTTQQDVTVVAPTEADESLVGNTPVQPDIPDLAAELGSIYGNGQGIGNQPFVFALAGDQSLTQDGLVDAFAPGAFTNVPDGFAQDTINTFNGTTLPSGATSFSQQSSAVRFGWTAADLLNPGNIDPSVCPGAAGRGGYPIECEIEATGRPSVMFISIGAQDALNGTDLGEFNRNLNIIVDTLVGNGVIPVLMTITPRADIAPETLQQYNDVIIEVANDKDVPLLNAWLLVNQLPQGVSGDGVTLSIAPNGAGDLDPTAVSTYGANALNAAIIELLGELRNNVLF